MIGSIANRSGKSCDLSGICDYSEYREQQYDRLEQALRKSLDIDRIYRIMGMKDDEE